MIQNHLPHQRLRHPGSLLIAGGLHYIATHPAEQLAHFQIGCTKVAQQRGGEWRIRAVFEPITGLLTGRGGEGDEDAAAGVNRRSQSTACTAAGGAPAAVEGIVAAGIENEDLGGGAGDFHRVDHLAERHSVVLGITLSVQASVDRHQIVLALHLHAMA